MHRLYRTIALILAAVPVLTLAVIMGCSPDSELGGGPLLNAMPDTRITGTPPVLRQTDFIVEFFWTGSDPDGSIVGYEWKMATNGLDGISIRDTLTYDPATGDTLNPWRFTTVTDSVFVVSADSSSFPVDDDLPEIKDHRFYQYHTLLVRAIDDEGAVDPTPAFITFTSTTIAPTVYVSFPPQIDKRGFFRVPPTATLGWTGEDSDFELGVPTKVRYLMKDSYFEEESQYIQTPEEFNDNKDKVISFSDPAWSDWVRYEPEAEDRRVVFPDIPKEDESGENIYYFFAVQAQDTAGAVSLSKEYNVNVLNFRIDNRKTPTIEVCEKFLGCLTSSGLGGRKQYDIAQGQPLKFNWSASASAYGGTLEALRYGWDVDDPDNDNDPGWQVSWGLSELHRESPERSFSTGQHWLTVEAIDNSGQLSRIIMLLNVVPVPEPSSQRPLLLVDDVTDETSNAWPSNATTQAKALDNDIYRDAFWEEALTQTGGVDGFVTLTDSYDLESGSQIGYRDIVDYRVVLWTTKYSATTYLHNNFDPSLDLSDKFVWLAPYQENVGNLILAGSGAIMNFHHKSPLLTGITSWELPIMYEATEDMEECGEYRYAVGFGEREDIDGNEFYYGPRQYPFTTLGFAVIDQLQPERIYGCGIGAMERKRNCVGTKAIFVDPEFKADFLGAGTFQDTIFVDKVIDWKDNVHPAVIPDVFSTYDFGSQHEIYDVNIAGRQTPYELQALPDGSQAIRPMFRVYTRYDYILDRHRAIGDMDYPTFDPKVACGGMSISLGTGRTRMDGSPIGVMSFKPAQTKPGGRADIIWGFDPYLMDRDEIKKVIHWTLGEYYGLPVAP